MDQQPTNDSNFAMRTKVWPGTAKLLEEMGELQQVLGKLIMTGGDTNHWSGDLQQMLIDELADVMASLQFFICENLEHDDRMRIFDRTNSKLEMFRMWRDGKMG